MANANPDMSGLTPYSKDHPPPPNRGRKPSKLKKYIKENSITTEDMKHVFKHILGLSIEQLQDIIADPKKPAIIAVAASAVLKDFTKGKLNNISTVLRKAQVESEQQEGNPGGDNPGSIGGSNQQFHEYSYPESDSLDG